VSRIRKKKTKNRMRATRRSLQAQPKILSNTKSIPIRTKIFHKKECLVTHNRKGAKNSFGSYPTEFAGSTQNPKKSSKHQIYQSEQKFSEKKYVSYLKKVKGPKIRMGATRRNFQAQPKILKKSSEHQIYQSKRIFFAAIVYSRIYIFNKFFLKKFCYF
jgi:hypothetical protein